GVACKTVQGGSLVAARAAADEVALHLEARRADGQRVDVDGEALGVEARLAGARVAVRVSAGVPDRSHAERAELRSEPIEGDDEAAVANERGMAVRLVLHAADRAAHRDGSHHAGLRREHAISDALLLEPREAALAVRDREGEFAPLRSM